MAVSGQGELLVRVLPEDTEQLLDWVHVISMVMAGREARGWLHIDSDGVKTKH